LNTSRCRSISHGLQLFLRERETRKRESQQGTIRDIDSPSQMADHRAGDELDLLPREREEVHGFWTANMPYESIFGLEKKDLRGVGVLDKDRSA
jgi:hypothetical protein